VVPIIIFACCRERYLERTLQTLYARLPSIPGRTFEVCLFLSLSRSLSRARTHVPYPLPPTPYTLHPNPYIGVGLARRRARGSQGPRPEQVPAGEKKFRV